MSGRDIFVIGASAGAVEALRRLMECLTSQLPAAIFVVVHRSKEHQLTQILTDKAPLPVHTAVDSRRFQPGNIYICPGDFNLSLENGLMRVEHSPKESIHRPSINALFRSAALTYGRRVVGVVLTGMLDDGTAGLLSRSAAASRSFRIPRKPVFRRCRKARLPMFPWIMSCQSKESRTR